MRRRAFLAGLAGALAAPAGAHTLLPQWVAYRRRNLLVGCHRKDPETYALAQALVAEINHALPEASARPARAPHPERLASLLGTDQLELAVLGLAEATLMAFGAGRFAPYGAIPLTHIAGLGTHALLAHAAFPDHHAWMIRAALVESAVLDEATPPLRPWHPGAEAYRQGKPIPAEQPT